MTPAPGGAKAGGCSEGLEQLRRDGAVGSAQGIGRTSRAGRADDLVDQVERDQLQFVVPGAVGGDRAVTERPVNMRSGTSRPTPRPATPPPPTAGPRTPRPGTLGPPRTRPAPWPASPGSPHRPRRRRHRGHRGARRWPRRPRAQAQDQRRPVAVDVTDEHLDIAPAGQAAGRQLGPAQDQDRGLVGKGVGHGSGCAVVLDLPAAASWASAMGSEAVRVRAASHQRTRAGLAGDDAPARRDQALRIPAERPQRPGPRSPTPSPPARRHGPGPRSAGARWGASAPTVAIGQSGSIGP